MNSKLTDYYISMSKLAQPNKMEEVSFLHIIDALEKHFNGKWSYEINSEMFAPDGSVLITTVTLYTPGRIYTGRSVCKVKDCGFNHLYALVDAAKPFTGANVNTPIKDSAEPNGQNSTYNMTPEEIVNALNSSGADTQARMANYKDEHNMPAEHVELPPSGQQQSVLESPHASNKPVDYDTPQQKLNGFTQHQVDRMNEFKRVMEILDNKAFCNYVALWSNNKLTSKKDITPDNIEEFLVWGEEQMKKL